MKRSLVAAAALLAMASMAHAGCSRASLNGNYVLDLGGQGLSTKIQSGPTTVFLGLGLATVKVKSFGSNCRGKFTAKVNLFVPLPITVNISGNVVSENIGGAGDAKPNQVVFNTFIGGLPLSRMP